MQRVSSSTDNVKSIIHNSSIIPKILQIYTKCPTGFGRNRTVGWRRATLCDGAKRTVSLSATRP